MTNAVFAQSARTDLVVGQNTYDNSVQLDDAWTSSEWARGVQYAGVNRGDYWVLSYEWYRLDRVDIDATFSSGGGPIQMRILPNSRQFEQFRDFERYCYLGDGQGGSFSDSWQITRDYSSNTCSGVLDELYIVLWNTDTTSSATVEYDLSVERTGIDTDDDGIANANEEELGTSIYDSDTDNDGIDDQTELEQGSDPTDESSTSGGLSQASLEDGGSDVERGFLTNNPDTDTQLPIITGPELTMVGFVLSVVGIFMQLLWGR